MNLTKFKTLKSDCRICIADNMCEKHQKIYDDWLAQ